MRVKRNGIVIFDGPHEGWKGASKPVERIDLTAERLPICRKCDYFTADAGKPCQKERCAGCWENVIRSGKCKDGRF